MLYEYTAAQGKMWALIGDNRGLLYGVYTQEAHFTRRNSIPSFWVSKWKLPGRLEGTQNGFCKKDYYHDRSMMCFSVDRPVAVS